MTGYVILITTNGFTAAVGVYDDYTRAYNRLRQLVIERPRERYRLSGPVEIHLEDK